MKRLGIDLGTSSLGWAILDDDKLANSPFNAENMEGIEAGVVIFPEGMDREKSGKLTSPAAERRQKRAMRRAVARRKLRKFHILKLLIAEGMCPMAPESLEQWQKEKKYPVDDKPFMEWLAATEDSNPYLDRKLAAETHVDKLTLGRAIYHLAQRRGFKSSRKELLQELKAQEDGNENQQRNEELGVVKQAIADLSNKIKAKANEVGTDLTLGQYFYTLFEKNEKVRGQKVGRIEHYEKEFDKIASVQQLPVELTQKIRNILFFQRPLRIQRHLVGWCELEKKKKYRRCLESHPTYEAFCVLSFLNNLRVLDDARNERRPLTDEERTKLYKYLKRTSATKVGDLRKQLGRNVTLNYRDDVRVPILEVTTRLEKLGIDQADWQKALNALVDFQDLNMLQAWAQRTFNLTPEKALKFASIDPSTERASYSLYALKKIVPFLEKGMLLHKAIFCANLPTIIPDYDAEKEAQILDAFAACEEAYLREKAEQASATHYQRVLPVKERWKAYLLNTYNITEEDYKKLYVDTSEPDPTKSVLPPVNMGAVRNPLVLRSLTVLRRLVNTLRSQGKIDADTRINIELAHAVYSSNMCSAIEMYQKERAKTREEQRTRLSEILQRVSAKTPITEDLLLRYALWEEQGRVSVYTGQPISEADMVLNCDIEHTIPRSRGGTNERINLTLCESHYNREIKKGRLPTECPNAETEWADPETHITYPALDQGIVLKAWRKELERLEKECAKKKPRRGADAAAYNNARQKYLVLEMKRDYWRKKCRTFTLRTEQVEQGGFIPRQMVDTGAITTRAVDYLKQLYAKTYCINGATTAFARKAWGIQAIDEAKSRIDHTHHAVDAMVIAALDHARFTSICTALRNNDHIADDRLATICPSPYEKFGERVHCAQEAIFVCQLVKNRTIHPVTKALVRKKVTLATPVKRADGTVIREVISKGSAVRGALHDDSMYGKILNGEEERVVIRKPFAADTLSDLKKLIESVVDPAVKATLNAQVETYIAQYEAQKIDEKVYGKLICSSPFYAPHKPENPNPPLIKRVRIFAQAKNAVKLRKHAFESHIDAHNYIYKNGGVSLRLEFNRSENNKLNMTSVGLFDEALRMKYGDRSSNCEMTIIPGRAILVRKNDETISDLKDFSPQKLMQRLYYIRKVNSGTGQVTLWYHREARAATILGKELKAVGKKEKGESKISFSEPERLLCVSSATCLGCLFEGRDFGLTLDGRIEWLNHD